MRAPEQEGGGGGRTAAQVQGDPEKVRAKAGRGGAPERGKRERAARTRDRPVWGSFEAENRKTKKKKITLEQTEERGIQAAYGDGVEGATLRRVRRPKLVGCVF